MDVQELAPALLALAEIIQAANRHFNGERASMRVLVNADTEQQCFQIDLHLVQTIFDHAKKLVGLEDVRTAKEIAEWVGLIAGTGTGLFHVIKFLYGRPQEKTEFRVTAGEGSVVMIVRGDGSSITVPRQVAELASDAEVVEKVKGVTRPLLRTGYSIVDFIDQGKIAFEVNKEEATAMQVAAPFATTTGATEDVTSFRGRVRIKAAQYEGGAKWTVLLNGRAVDASITHEEWVRGFQENEIAAPPHSILDVDGEVRVVVDERGEAIGKPTYVIKQVHSVTLPAKVAQQIDWVEEQGRSGQADSSQPITESDS